MSEYRLFAQRIGLVGVTNLLSALSGILLLPVLTKNIPVEDYGIWTQISVTTGLLSTVVLLGLPYSMIRFLASEKNKEEIQEGFYSIFIIVLSTSAISSLMILFFSRPLASFLFNGNTAIAELLAPIIFIEPLINLLFNYLRTFQQIKRHSILIFTNTYINIVLVACFVLSGYGIYGAVAGLLITRYLIFIIMFSLIASEIGIKIPRFRNVRDYLALGLPVVPEALAGWAVNSSDRYMIGLFLGTAYVGYYSPGYVLGSVINLFIAPLSFILPAALSRCYDSNNPRQVEFIMRYSLKYFLAIAIPSVFGLSFLSKPILEVLSSPQIASQGYLVTPFAASGSLLLGIFAIISNVIVLKKKTAISAAIWMAAAVIDILLNLLLIPSLGIIGAAMTALIAFSFILILSAYFSFKYIVINVDYLFILKSLQASGLMSLILLEWIPAGTWEILAEIALCAAVYFIILLILKGIEGEEFSFFLNLLRKTP
jgi:O-antigen/teichoic acid export membrane protein